MGDDNVRLVCFYLPQYHPIPENDARWGKGYSEWRNIVQAKPLFPGHYQPRIPADLGFYDLRLPESQIEQAELAARYGINGFCYYFYWFGGRRVLNRPLDQILASGRPDFPFCVCWANHHWHEGWRGHPEQIFLEQVYSEQDAVDLIRFLIPVFKDPRYIRVDGKPVFVVFDTRSLPDPVRYASIWRSEAKAAGLADLYLCRMEVFLSFCDPETIGFDAAIEFPPHSARYVELPVEPLDPSSGFSGKIHDYGQTAFYMLNRLEPDYKLLRGVMPAWDNSPRRPPKDAAIWHHSTPEAYCQWLHECIQWTRAHRQTGEQLVFINGWNEWAEGAYLEPDLLNGHAYLQATQRALSPGPEPAGSQYANIRRADYRLEKTALVDESSGETLTVSPEIVGAIYKVWEAAGKLCVAGWACDLAAPAVPVVVLLWAGERLLAVERTYINHADVIKHVHPEAYRSGFHIEIDSSALDKPDHQLLQIAVVSDRQRYAIMPVESADTDEPATAKEKIWLKAHNLLRSFQSRLHIP